MIGSPDISRRQLLSGLTVPILGVIAGCEGEQGRSTDTNTSETPDDQTETEPADQRENSTGAETGGDTDTATDTDTRAETVVFTDSPPNTRAETPTESTSTQTETGERIVYDGGDGEAFLRALEELSDRPGSTLEIREGRYRLDPPTEREGHPHFEIHNLQGCTIEGNGATLVFTDPLRGGVHFLGGSDVTIRNLSIDYDPVPYTQGTIRDVGGDRRVFTVELDEGYPSLDHEMFEVARHVAGNVHDPDGEFITETRSAGDPFKRFDSIDRTGAREFELTLSDTPGQNGRGLAVGNRFSVTARGGYGQAHVIEFTYLDRPTVENVAVFASPDMAIQANLCTDPEATGVSIAPPPSSDRIHGSIGDGMHFKNGFSGPTIENCYIGQVGDDGIVVDAVMTEITAMIDDRTVEVVGNAFHVEEGDLLEACTGAAVRKGDISRVADIEYRNLHHASYVPSRPERIRFEEPVSEMIEEGDYLTNTARANSDFLIQNNEVRNSIANPIRLGAGPGVVEENELVGCAINGIWLRCDTSGTFVPKRWSNDVEIRNNRISETGLSFFASATTAGVHVQHKPADDEDTQGTPHRNITCLDNEIQAAADDALLLEDATRVRVESNRMSDLNRLPDSDGGYGIGLRNIEDASLVGNTVRGTDEALDQFGWKARTDTVTMADNELVIDGESEPVTLEDS